MQRILSNDLGCVPSVKGAAMPAAFAAQMKQAFAGSMATPYQTHLPVVKGLAELEALLLKTDDDLTHKRIGPDDFTRRLDAELNAAVMKAYS